jgi:hypothetical protein
MLWIQIFLLLPLLLISEEDKLSPLLASLESEPSGIVDGCVNPISGSYFDYEMDLSIPGPEPMTVERVLLDNNIHALNTLDADAPEWSFNDAYQLGFWKLDEDSDIGFKAVYYGPLGELLNFKFHQKKYPAGERTNISAKLLKNARLTLPTVSLAPPPISAITN